MIVWITGLSAAGKSTLCKAMHDILSPHLPGLVVLEGEDLRNALGNDLGHSPEDRLKALARVQGVVRLLSGQGMPMIVACVYMPEQARAWNRKHLDGYFDVHLDVSIETVTKRDPKGIYKKALAGEIENVMGVDLEYEKPQSAAMTLDCDQPRAPEESAIKVALAAAPVLSCLTNDQRHALERQLAADRSEPKTRETT